MKSNTKRNELLDQLQLLDQRDNGYRIDTALAAANADECSKSTDMQPPRDNTCYVLPASDNEERICDNDDKANANIESDSDDDGDGNATSAAEHLDLEDVEDPGHDIVLDDRREGEEGAQDTTIINVVDEDHKMAGCRGAFDANNKCVMALCDGRRGVLDEAAKKVVRLCKCRGRKVSESAKDLSERIVADWKLGEVDQQNPEFKDKKIRYQ